MALCIPSQRQEVSFSEPSPGRMEVGVGSFETVRMSMLLIVGSQTLSKLFFFKAHTFSFWTRATLLWLC